MTSRTRYWLLAFALLGLGASGTSTYVHHQLLTDPTYTSFCDVSGTVSCTQAYLSAYGSVLGVPVALVGVIFFAAILLMIALAPVPAAPVPAGKKARADGTKSVHENVTAYVFALSAFGLAFSLYLAWASFFQLRAICVLCAMTYVAVLGLFIVSARANSVGAGAIPRRALQDMSTLLRKPAASAAVVALAVGAGLAIAAFPDEIGDSGEDADRSSVGADRGVTAYPPLTDAQRMQFEQWYNEQPVVHVPIDKGSAKVLIVKFNDYQCPPCRQTYDQYKSMLAKYSATGNVKYVLKHFPLELECNTRNANHTAACEAAAAIVMASERGTADRLEQWLFANQGPPQLSTEQVRAAASVIGGITDFDARYASVLKQVAADVELGHKLGAESTPTFFINGRRIAGGLPPAAFEAAIQVELNRR
jgi:uncharacterized membrane protein/protein-disulfide isomerase